MALDRVSDYSSEVRRILKDTVAPYRFADSDILSGLNLALLEARRLRPDLFAGRLRAVPPSYSALTSAAVDMDPQYRVAIVYYICGAVQIQDEETTQDQRATVFLNKFTSQMLTLAS
jgi:hypothetical protein